MHLGLGHAADAVEDGAAIDEELGRGELAVHAGAGVNLDQLLGLDVGPDLAAPHDQRADLELAAHFGAAPDDQDVVTQGLAAEVTVDAHPAFEAQLALVGRTAPEQSVDFTDGRERLGFHGHASYGAHRGWSN